MYTCFEEEVVINGAFPLSGTVCTPQGSGPFPSVIIVSGSGNGDRDGNFTQGKLFPNIYKGIAHHISSLGYITLRVDKRGCAKSGGNFLETGMHDLVDDIIAIIHFLRKHPSSSKILLLGHSEGCTLIAAADAREPVDGLIFLSGGAQSISDALVEQRERAKTELLNMKGFKGFLARTFHVDRLIDKQAHKMNEIIMRSEKPVITYKMQKINAAWFKEHYQYDVFSDLQHISVPVLAVNGDKDIQVTAQKVHDMKKYVTGEVETVVIENMDHLLKETTEEASILLVGKSYKKLQHQSLHPQLQEVLSSFLSRFALQKASNQ